MNSFQHDSRVLKACRVCAEIDSQAPIKVAALWQDGLATEEYIDERICVWRPRLRTRSWPRLSVVQVVKYLEWLWRIAAKMRLEPPAVIHAHSLGALPVGVVAKWMTGAPLIYDAHELETEAYGIGSLERRLSRWMESFLIKRADSVVTVCDSIADWYEEHYGVAPPAVVRNVPDWEFGLSSGSDALRRQLGIPVDALIFLYQGALSPGRGIHAAVQAFERLDPDRHLVLMGFGVLEDEIRRVSAASDYVHFREAVPPHDLAEYTSSADIGLCLIEPVCLSNYFCLPNKLFEYIGSGIPVIASDLPEQRALIEAYDCGWVVGDDEEALGRLLASIDRDAVNRKAAGVGAARRSLSWSKEAEVLKNTYRALGIDECNRDMS